MPTAPRSWEPHGDHYHKTNNQLVFLSPTRSELKTSGPHPKIPSPQAQPAMDPADTFIEEKEGLAPGVRIQTRFSIQPLCLGPWPSLVTTASCSSIHPLCSRTQWWDKHTAIRVSPTKCVRGRWVRREEHSSLSVLLSVPSGSRAAILPLKKGIPGACSLFHFWSYTWKLLKRGALEAAAQMERPLLYGQCHLSLHWAQKWIQEWGECCPWYQERRCGVMEDCTLTCSALHLNLLCCCKCVVFALTKGTDEREEVSEWWGCGAHGIPKWRGDVKYQKTQLDCGSLGRFFETVL